MKPKYSITIGNISTFDYYNTLMGVELIDYVQSKKGTVSIETKKTKEAIISLSNLNFDPMEDQSFKSLLDQLKEKCQKLNHTLIMTEDI